MPLDEPAVASIVDLLFSVYCIPHSIDVVLQPPLSLMYLVASQHIN